jgi:hypothetical protein
MYAPSHPASTSRANRPRSCNTPKTATSKSPPRTRGPSAPSPGRAQPARKTTPSADSSPFYHPSTTSCPWNPPAKSWSDLSNNPLSVSNSSAFLQYFTPRDQVITQRLYRPHNCSPACKDYVRHNLGKLRGHNPLSKPLLCGWARITQKVKGRKEIVYKAPCSRILRNMQEVHRYLRMTKSEMTVDLFDFNHMVRCLAEFNVECIPDPKDLSKGTAALTWGLSFLLSCFKA